MNAIKLLVLLFVCNALALPLDDFINTPDAAYSWSVVSNTTIDSARVIVLDLVSQTWNSAGETVSPSVWHHWLTICIPASPITAGGILYIDGGDTSTPAPTQPDSLVSTFCSSGITTASIEQIPNQPLLFSGDPATKVEDEISAYSWKRYLETGNTSSLVWFAMAKAAVRALDTVQSITSVNKFVLAGASKRGWAAWLTAAYDPRVVGVCAVVAPVFQMKDFLNEQYTNLGEFTYALSWYEDQGVMDVLNDPLSRTDSFFDMVDAYSYVDRLTMPKLFVDATGDQFFMVDILNPFFQSLKGSRNVRMVPNTDHGFQVVPPPVADIGVFAVSTLNNLPLPQLSWSYQENVVNTTTMVINVDTAYSFATLVSAVLWTANTASTERRDFRMFTCRPTTDEPSTDPCYQEITWTSQVIAPTADVSVYEVALVNPSQGWLGGYVEFIYFSPLVSTNFSVTTEVAIVPNTHPFAPCPCGSSSSSTTSTSNSTTSLSSSTSTSSSSTSTSSTSSASFTYGFGMLAVFLVALVLAA